MMPGRKTSLALPVREAKTAAIAMPTRLLTTNCTGLPLHQPDGQQRHRQTDADGEAEAEVVADQVA